MGFRSQSHWKSFLFYPIFALTEEEKQTGLLKKYSYPSLLVLLWAIAVIIVDPRGEFPVNDDWAYAKNVKALVEDGKFSVDSWPAMTLVSQTIYGSAVAALFGFSFTALRCSVLFLGILASIVLFLLLKKRCGNGLISFLLAAGFCFSQLFVALSFTYMTDVFFLSFLIFALHRLVLYLEEEKKSDYLLYCLFCLIAVLNRQQGLLLPLLIAFPLLFKRRFSFRNLTLASLPFMLCLGAHFGYRYLLKLYSVSNNMWGARQMMKSVNALNVESASLQAGDIIISTGWLLFPLALLFCTSPPEFRLRRFLLFLVTALGVLLVSFGALSLFPSGNVSMISSVGPKALKDYFENIQPRYPLSEGLRWFVAGLAFFSATTIVFRTFGLKYFYAAGRDKEPSLNVSLLFFMVVYFFFSVLNPAYFDRYVLPLALVALVLNVGGEIRINRPSILALAVVVSGIFLLSVFTEKDLMNWQRTRWAALRDLESKGVSPGEIDGGFEYNAWYKPGKGFYPDSDPRSWWWVDRDDYLIANGEYPGYKMINVYTYPHFVPYTTDTLFVLQKSGGLRFNEKVKEIELQIRSDSAWLSNIKKQAIENHKSLDSMIRENALWMMDHLPASSEKK